MDLSEIRKKAKSRKRKEEDRRSAQRRGNDPAAEPERPQKDEIGVPSPEVDVEIREKANRVPDSLESLKSVLMSQQEDEEEEEEERLQLLVFLLGQEEYALNIMDIKEIIRPGEITEVPRAPDFIQGIMSLRGTIIPVMDVNRRLGLPAPEGILERPIIVVTWRGHLFGLFVDGVVQVMDLPLADIEPPPEIFGDVEGEYLGGVGKVEDRLIILLNLVRLLALEEELPEQELLPAGNGE